MSFAVKNCCQCGFKGSKWGRQGYWGEVTKILTKNQSSHLSRESAQMERSVFQLQGQSKSVLPVLASKPARHLSVIQNS